MISCFQRDRDHPARRHLGQPFPLSVDFIPVLALGFGLSVLSKLSGHLSRILAREVYCNGFLIFLGFTLRNIHVILKEPLAFTYISRLMSS